MNIIRVAFMGACIIGLMQELSAGSEDDTSSGTTHLHSDSKTGHSWLATAHTGIKYTQLTLKKQKKSLCQPRLERMRTMLKTVKTTVKLAAGRVEEVLENLDKKPVWTADDQKEFAEALKQLNFLESVVNSLPERYNNALYAREFQGDAGFVEKHQLQEPALSKDILGGVCARSYHSLPVFSLIAIVCVWYCYKRLRKQNTIDDKEGQHQRKQACI